jgi:hypothetical protein
LANKKVLTWTSAFTYRYFWCCWWLYFALLRPFQTLDFPVEIITQDSDTKITEAMEVMAVTVDMGMGMVVVIMDMVTMVITKRLFLLSSDALKIVQEQVLLQRVCCT